MSDFDFDAKNRSVHATYFWTHTAVSDKAKFDAKLTFAASILTIVSCSLTLFLYFKYRTIPACFNSSNHFFAMAFGLAILGACNYCAAAAIRLWATDIDLIVGYCDVSAIHVLIIVYPCLLCELLYFWSALRRLKAAQVLTKTGAGSGGRNAGDKFISSAAAVSSSSNFAAHQPQQQQQQPSALPADGDDLPSSSSNFAALHGGATRNSTAALARRMLFNNNNESSSSAADGYGTANDNAQHHQEQQDQQQQQQMVSEEEKLATALEIVDSGENFFRRGTFFVLFTMAILAVVVNAALPVQKRWDTRFDPTSASWCWIPVSDEDDDHDASTTIHSIKDRDGGFIALQLIVEIPTLLGTPIAGIISLIMLYRALSSFPKAAWIRSLYIVVFMTTFVAGIVLRLRFSSDTSASFVAFCEPSIGFFNSICFFFSEIYPAVRQKRTISVLDGGAGDALLAGDGGGGGGAGDNDGSDAGGEDDDDDELYIEPTLAVLIEAAAFVTAAAASASASSPKNKFVTQDGDDEDEDGNGGSPIRASHGGNNLNAHGDENDGVLVQSRITRTLEDFAQQQRTQSSHMVFYIFSVMVGFVDVWSFIAFGVFTGAASAANFGVASLSIAYHNWAPSSYKKFAQPTEHAALMFIAILVPPLTAALASRGIFRRFFSCCSTNAAAPVTLDRGTATVLLGVASFILFATWASSLLYYARAWFDHSDEAPWSRYVAVTGLSLWSGILLLFHRIFLPTLALPIAPYFSSQLFDVLGGFFPGLGLGLSDGCVAILNHACEDRFPLPLQRSSAAIGSVGYICGAAIALVSGTFQTGGAFCFLVVLSQFSLLLLLDWPVLSSTSVTVSADEEYFVAKRRGGGGGGGHLRQSGIHSGDSEYTSGGVRRSTREALRQSLVRRESDVSLHATTVDGSQQQQSDLNSSPFYG